MLIILGLTYGAYAVETRMATSTKPGADAGATQGGKRQKLGRDKSSASLINETDTDSSASDSSDGSDSDDEIAGGAPSPTKDATAIPERCVAQQVEPSTIIESNNGCVTSSSAKHRLTEAPVQNESERQSGSPSGVVSYTRHCFMHFRADTSWTFGMTGSCIYFISWSHSRDDLGAGD